MQIPELDSEEYYIMRDDFLRYIDDDVNPARFKAGLAEIKTIDARECYRILYDFWKKWEVNRI